MLKAKDAHAELKDVIPILELVLGHGSDDVVPFIAEINGDFVTVLPCRCVFVHIEQCSGVN
jgi:hypothetical protein